MISPGTGVTSMKKQGLHMNGIVAWAVIGVPTLVAAGGVALADGEMGWADLIKATPIGAAMIALVYLGLRYLENRDKKHAEMWEHRDALEKERSDQWLDALAARDTTLRTVADDNRKTQERSLECMDANTTALATNSEVLRRIERKLEEK